MVAYTLIEVYQNAVLDILSEHATQEKDALSPFRLVSLVQEKYTDYAAVYIKSATLNLVRDKRIIMTTDWRVYLPE